MSEIAAETFASPLVAAATLFRFLAYVAALMSAGGMLFAAVIHDRRPDERARLVGATTAAAVIAAGATVLGVAIQGALITDRGTAALADVSVLAAVFASPFGTSAIVRTISLALLVLAVRAVWRRWAVAVGLGAAVAVSGSFLLTGHTVQAEPGWLAITSGLVHTLAAAAWFGGLVMLGITLRARRDADAAQAATVVARFSTVATAAVILVSVAGAARATTLMPLTAAGLGSAYGVVLVAKVLLVGVVFVVAGYNHRYLVPAVRAAGDAAQRRLRRTVRFEGLALAVVIAASAVLANLSPPDPQTRPTTATSDAAQVQAQDR